MRETETRKRVFEEILRVVIVPTLSAVAFFIWSFNMIKSEPPKMLIFPLSSILVAALYFFSGPVYGGVLLAFLTIAGFLAVFLADSNVSRLIFLGETFWLWGLFFIFEHYQKTLDGIENRNRVEEEILETRIALTGVRIEDSRSRSADLAQRIVNYQSLGNMVHQLGQTLEEEKIMPLISELAFKFIGKGNWAVKKGIQSDIFAGHVKTNQVPLIVRDLATDNRFLVRHPRFLSLIAVPLEVNQRYWGILKGTAAAMDFFDESDLRVLSALGGIASLALNNVKLYERTQDLAITDGLTGLYVQSYFKERLNEEMLRSYGHKLPLSVALLDIDHFKNVNDTYGHAAGDAVLIQIGDFLRHRLRETDFMSRYGGEEFGVVMPQTDSDEAFRVIEEIRKNIAAEKFFLPVESFHPVQIKITVSSGLASLPARNITYEDFLKKADEGLYKAKGSGRNKTVFAEKH